MSVQGSLRGQCWSQLSQPPDTDPLTGAAQPASVRISPVPAPSDDVMKLPREDMTTFGRCPAWDNFVLVTCDKCDKIVKIEAFESHMTLRHGSKSERSAYHRVLAARAAASLQSCEVKLTPCSTATHSSSSSVGDRRSPAALHPLAEAELPSSSCTSPQPSPSPPPDSEPMDTSDPAESLPHKFVSEEADSTTNNVISIPDTDDMANIEIISEGQSLLDSMDSKFSFAPTSAPAAASVDSTSFTLAASSPKPGSSSCVTPPVSRSALDPVEAASSPGPSLPTPTHYITVSSLSKPSPTKKLVLGRMVEPPVSHPAPPSPSLFADAWSDQNHQALRTSWKRAFGEDPGRSVGGRELRGSGAAVPLPMKLLLLQGVPNPPQRRQLQENPRRWVNIPLDSSHEMQDPRMAPANLN